MHTCARCFLDAAPTVDYDVMRRQVRDETPAKVQQMRQYVARLQKAEAAAKDTVDLCAITVGF